MVLYTYECLKCIDEGRAVRQTQFKPIDERDKATCELNPDHGAVVRVFEPTLHRMYKAYNDRKARGTIKDVKENAKLEEAAIEFDHTDPRRHELQSEADEVMKIRH